jgi:hypothetical protein
MWSSFALAAAVSLASAQPGGGLQLGNVRMTVGELGPTRKDNKFIAGDNVYISYEVNGITIGEDGSVNYTMAMEVTDAAGKTMFKQAPQELYDFVPLRGGKLPALALINIGLDQDPGAYTCKITVTDPKAKASNSLAVKFEVLKPEFAIVTVTTSHDDAGRLAAPASGVVGQRIFILFKVASFQRDPKTKQPHVEFLFEIFDDKGQPTLIKPTRHIQDAASAQVEDKAGAFPVRFPFYMSRPGKFTVRITATDKVANKKSTFELPVSISPAN